MRITNTHVYFWDGIFSNFYLVGFIIGECQFSNTEQAFMFQKAKTFGDDETAQKILQEPNPSKVKKLGRLIRGYNDIEWAKVRFNQMIFVNQAKYTQNKKCADALKETGYRILVEASPFDRIWGVGLPANDDLILDEGNWLGENLLGKSLMQVRSALMKTNAST